MEQTQLTVSSNKSKKISIAKKDRSINNTNSKNVSPSLVEPRKNYQLKEMKLIKVIEDIKVLEKAKKKEDIISDTSSDSQNEEDVLEKNKLLEF